MASDFGPLPSSQGHTPQFSWLSPTLITMGTSWNRQVAPCSPILALFYVRCCSACRGLEKVETHHIFPNVQLLLTLAPRSSASSLATSPSQALWRAPRMTSSASSTSCARTQTTPGSNGRRAQPPGTRTSGADRERRGGPRRLAMTCAELRELSGRLEVASKCSLYVFRNRGATEAQRKRAEALSGLREHAPPAPDPAAGVPYSRPREAAGGGGSKHGWDRRGVGGDQPPQLRCCCRCRGACGAPSSRASFTWPRVSAR